MKGESHEITNKEGGEEGMMETENIRFSATQAKEVLEKAILAEDREKRDAVLKNAGLNEAEGSEIRVALGILREGDLRTQLELISLLSRDGKLAEATKAALVLHLYEETEKAAKKQAPEVKAKSEPEKEIEAAQEASPILRVSLEEKKVIDAAEAANPELRPLFIEAVRIRKMKDKEEREEARYVLRNEFYRLISEEAEKIEKELENQSFSGKWGAFELFDIAAGNRKPRIIRAIENTLRRWIGTETLKNEELAQKGLEAATAESSVWKELMRSLFSEEDARLLEDTGYLYATLNRTLNYRLGKASWHDPRYTLTNMVELTDTLLKNRDMVLSALSREAGTSEAEKILDRLMGSAERIGAFLTAKSKEEDIKIRGLIASHMRDTAPQYKEMVRRLLGKTKEELLAELDSGISRANEEELRTIERALQKEHPFEALQDIQEFSRASMVKQVKEEMRRQIKTYGPETFPVNERMIEIEIISGEASRIRKEAAKAEAEASRLAAAGRENKDSRELAFRASRLHETANTYEDALKYRTLEIEVGL